MIRASVCTREGGRNTQAERVVHHDEREVPANVLFLEIWLELSRHNDFLQHVFD
jgi:hypothetical protein